MNQLYEYDTRGRVRGFSVLDEDFDSMLVDFCRGTREESSQNEPGKPLAKNSWIRPCIVGRGLWGMSKDFLRYLMK
jgi:hypothetical protein